MFRMHHRFLVGVMYASFLIAPAASVGAELKDETLKTWDAYIQTANSQMHGRLQGPFLWVDEDPDRVTSVRAGKIVGPASWQEGPQARAVRINPRLDGAGVYPRRSGSETFCQRSVITVTTMNFTNLQLSMPSRSVLKGAATSTRCAW